MVDRTKLHVISWVGGWVIRSHGVRGRRPGTYEVKEKAVQAAMEDDRARHVYVHRIDGTVERVIRRIWVG